MRRYLASILSLMALSSIAPVLADDFETVLRQPIGVSTPDQPDTASVVDNDLKENHILSLPQQIADASSDPNSKKQKQPKQPKQPKPAKQPKQASQPAQQNQASNTGKSSSFPKSGISGQFEKFGQFAKTLPKRLPPALICGVGGTPIAAVQQTIIATKDGVKDIVGDSKFPLFIAPALCISVPYALVSGVIGGPVASLYNGWTYSKDKPFSRQSFSLPAK